MAEASRYAVVEDSIVVNVVLWDGESDWAPPEGCTAIACPADVGPGWSIVDGEWVAPEEEDLP